MSDAESLDLRRRIIYFEIIRIYLRICETIVRLLDYHHFRFVEKKTLIPLISAKENKIVFLRVPDFLRKPEDFSELYNMQTSKDHIYLTLVPLFIHKEKPFVKGPDFLRKPEDFSELYHLRTTKDQIYPTDVYVYYANVVRSETSGTSDTESDSDDSPDPNRNPTQETEETASSNPGPSEQPESSGTQNTNKERAAEGQSCENLSTEHMIKSRDSDTPTPWYMILPILKANVISESETATSPIKGPGALETGDLSASSMAPVSEQGISEQRVGEITLPRAAQSHLSITQSETDTKGFTTTSYLQSTPAPALSPYASTVPQDLDTRTLSQPAEHEAGSAVEASDPSILHNVPQEFGVHMTRPPIVTTSDLRKALIFAGKSHVPPEIASIAKQNEPGEGLGLRIKEHILATETKHRTKPGALEVPERISEGSGRSSTETSPKESTDSNADPFNTTSTIKDLENFVHASTEADDSVFKRPQTSDRLKKTTRGKGSQHKSSTRYPTSESSSNTTASTSRYSSSSAPRRGASHFSARHSLNLHSALQDTGARPKTSPFQRDGKYTKNIAGLGDAPVAQTGHSKTKLLESKKISYGKRKMSQESSLLGYAGGKRAYLNQKPSTSAQSTQSNLTGFGATHIPTPRSRGSDFGHKDSRDPSRHQRSKTIPVGSGDANVPSVEQTLRHRPGGSEREQTYPITSYPFKQLTTQRLELQRVTQMSQSGARSTPESDKPLRYVSKKSKVFCDVQESLERTKATDRLKLTNTQSPGNIDLLRPTARQPRGLLHGTPLLQSGPRATQKRDNSLRGASRKSRESSNVPSRVERTKAIHERSSCSSTKLAASRHSKHVPPKKRFQQRYYESQDTKIPSDPSGTSSDQSEAHYAESCSSIKAARRSYSETQSPITQPSPLCSLVEQPLQSMQTTQHPGITPAGKSSSGDGEFSNPKELTKLLNAPPLLQQQKIPGLTSEEGKDSRKAVNIRRRVPTTLPTAQRHRPNYFTPQGPKSLIISPEELKHTCSRKLHEMASRLTSEQTSSDNTMQPPQRTSQKGNDSFSKLHTPGTSTAAKSKMASGQHFSSNLSARGLFGQNMQTSGTFQGSKAPRSKSADMSLLKKQLSSPPMLPSDPRLHSLTAESSYVSRSSRRDLPVATGSKPEEQLNNPLTGLDLINNAILQHFFKSDNKQEGLSSENIHSSSQQSVPFSSNPSTSYATGSVPIRENEPYTSAIRESSVNQRLLRDKLPEPPHMMSERLKVCTAPSARQPLQSSGTVRSERTENFQSSDASRLWNEPQISLREPHAGPSAPEHLLSEQPLRDSKDRKEGSETGSKSSATSTDKDQRLSKSTGSHLKFGIDSILGEQPIIFSGECMLRSEAGTSTQHMEVLPSEEPLHLTTDEADQSDTDDSES